MNKIRTMKNGFKSWQLIALCGMMLCFTACEDNNENKGSLLGGAGDILIQTTVKNADGASGSSYLQQIPDLAGMLNMGNSLQVGFGSSVTVSGNDVFVFPEFGAKGAQMMLKYKHTPQGLQAMGEMQVAPGAYPVNLTKINEEKAYVPLYILGRVMILNPKTMKKIGEIDLKDYAHKDASCEPAYGILRDGLYYLPLDQLAENFMPHADYRQVDVAVIDPATDKVLKVISETATNLCFPTRPMLKDMIFADEQHDIYIACAGYFGYDPTYTKNGFVCIPAGQQSFDTTKSWDISGVGIQGTEHNNEAGQEVLYQPATVYNCKYMGQGKLAAFVGISALNGDNPYTARNSMAVIIDLKAKTIQKVVGVPLTDGHSIAIEMRHGKALFAAYGKNAAGVFAYNPVTGDVEHMLTAHVNVAFMHFFK